LFNEDYHRQLQVLVAQTAENLMDAPLREIPVEQDQAVRGSTGGRAEHGEHPSACLDPFRTVAGLFKRPHQGRARVLVAVDDENRESVHK
jgi:hypothetical protein